MQLILISQIRACLIASVFLSPAVFAQTPTAKTQSATKSDQSSRTAKPLGPAKVISTPGLWETTTLGVLDNGASSRSVATRCITAQDVRNPEAILPQHAVVGLTCVNNNVKFSGNKAIWKVSCIGSGQAIDGDGNLTFAAKTQTGSSKLAHGVGGKTVRTEKIISAKLLGPCDIAPSN